MKLKDWLLLAILSIIWGSSFIFIKIALREISPFMIVFTRLCLAFVFLLIICRIRGIKFPSSGRTILSLGFLGVINTSAPFFLISWAQQHIDTATASILNATSPVFVMVLAHFFTKDEKLTAHKVVGVLAGIAGVIVMVIPAWKPGASLSSIGPFAMLGATFLYAVASIFAKRFNGIPPVMIATVSLLGGILFLLPSLILSGLPRLSELDSNTYMSIAFLGIFCTAIAYLIYFKILSSAGATNVLLVTLLIPISTLILSTTILNETLKGNDIKGMMLIFAGLLIIDGRITKMSYSAGKKIWSKCT